MVIIGTARISIRQERKAKQEKGYAYRYQPFGKINNLLSERFMQNLLELFWGLYKAWGDLGKSPHFPFLTKSGC